MPLLRISFTGNNRYCLRFIPVDFAGKPVLLKVIWPGLDRPHTIQLSWYIPSSDSTGCPVLCSGSLTLLLGGLMRA